MYFADTVSGRPISKDRGGCPLPGPLLALLFAAALRRKVEPGVEHRRGTSRNLVRLGEGRGSFPAEGTAEEKGFCAPGAIVLGGKVAPLSNQTYGNARRDAICHAWSNDGCTSRKSYEPHLRPTVR
jgi:hypothetical protein